MSFTYPLFDRAYLYSLESTIWSVATHPFHKVDPMIFQYCVRQIIDTEPMYFKLYLN